MWNRKTSGYSGRLVKYIIDWHGVCMSVCVQTHTHTELSGMLGLSDIVHSVEIPLGDDYRLP